MSSRIKVLVVGCGHMGASHALAYHKLDAFEIVGLVSRGPESREKLSKSLGGDISEFSDYAEALKATRPDAVCISTYPDTHAEYAIMALEAGAHVFVEKPIALTVEEARKVVDVAEKLGKKVVVGYILRQHPAWIKFIDIARGLGKPLVMRMNLNQQSRGEEWRTHKNLMNSMAPIVDCGVHYVDVMCQMTNSRPVRVYAIGARLSDEIKPDMYNYGQLQVTFEDGSVGWYEAGWGPMMSEEAFFIKDVVGPKGSASIVAGENESDAGSASVDSHTKTNLIKVHHAELTPDGQFAKKDEFIDTRDEPDHDALCEREQIFFRDAILNDGDVTDHLRDAINSLRIVLACDESVKTGQVVQL